MLNRTCLLCSILLAFCVAQETEERESRLVIIDQGPVRGYKDPLKDLFVFYNIPYATAPTGPNRYKAPLPGPTWLEPLDASNKGIVCPQKEDWILYLNITVEEDCLVANVYTPDTETKNLPVVVHVHGGGFQIGYGDSIVPKNLVQLSNIVAVTFNYRLGVHGFLCLGTENAPGNAGMKDQVALLRWVKKNIARFGGNPNDVTITGCSAGSASVDLLMLSKTTKGLFNKVISGSGSSISPFAVQIDPLETAKEHAKTFNLSNVDDISILEEFYKTSPFELLLADPFVERKDAAVEFAPCVERDIGEEMFLDEAPFHTLMNNNYTKMPIIYGFTNMDGLLWLPYFGHWKHGMNENFSDFLPVDLHFQSEENRKEVAQTIKVFYFGDQPVNEDTILSFIDYSTDVVFSHPMLWSIEMQVENGNSDIYLYEFSFVDDDTAFVPYTNIRGAEHCAQEFALLDGRRPEDSDESSLSEEFKHMKAIIREMWYNFIVSGEPVPKNSSLPVWPPVGVNRSPHMSLGQTVELRGALVEQRTQFWDKIYSSFYRMPQAPVPYSK